MLEANQCLEVRIREADPAHDEALIRFFYRHSRRREWLLDDAMLAQGDQGKVAHLQLLRDFG